MTFIPHSLKIEIVILAADRSNAVVLPRLFRFLRQFRCRSTARKKRQIGSAAADVFSLVK